MTSDRYQSEVLVIGAGVIGLSVARHFAQAGREVTVLDAQPQIGKGISTRNSGVIHAGLYYPEDSLKARTCIRGRELLYDYAKLRNISHRQTGKLIIAADDSEIAALETLKSNADAIGGGPLSWATAGQLEDLAPGIKAKAALWSPSTGIIDSGALLLSLAADLEQAGGQIVLNSPVSRLTDDPGVILDDADQTRVTARLVINAAGLRAHSLAANLHPGDAWLPKAHFAKGHYFSLSGPCPVKTLVYPVPADGGLGVHLTLSMDGRARFGPDVEWLDNLDDGTFVADRDRQPLFEQAIRRYWPDLPEGKLHPDDAGIRPKLFGPGETPADFMITGPDLHGGVGMVHCLGIESPGLTAAFALAETMAEAVPMAI
ncbi:L2HGDH [Symbiodinium microadriaticum]|nr:L2HGDH [Symbiodinium microadriaticum]